MKIEDFNKKYNSLKNVVIEFNSFNLKEDVELYKNTKTSSGHMSTKISLAGLIQNTIIIYLHMMCDNKDFNPVIRVLNYQDKVSIAIFKFDNKFIKDIKKVSKKIANLYVCKSIVKEIDFKEHYSSVMSNLKLNHEKIYFNKWS